MMVIKNSIRLQLKVSEYTDGVLVLIIKNHTPEQGAFMMIYNRKNNRHKDNE